MLHFECMTIEKKYPSDTVGRRMTESVPITFVHQTLRHIHDMLTEHGKSYSTIDYVYVLNVDRTLYGILSVHELFQKDLNVTAGEACKKFSLLSVHPETHQEHAAYVALKNNIKAIPVLDHQGVFLGELTSDSILSILQKEMHEDTLKRAGIRHPEALRSNVLTLPLLTSFRHRIPWLLLGLLGGLLTANIIGFFEATLARNLVLAAFIPLIVYMSDAVGTQMEAYIIRDLALEKALPIWRYAFRHFCVVMGIGFFLSCLLAASYGLFVGDWHIAFVLSVSLFFSVCSSVLTGLLIPFAFSKFSLDPADASGPIATVIQDMISVVIYFGIATMML